MREPLSIEDAKVLFETLKNDLTHRQEEEIALILLYLVANPQVMEYESILREPFSPSYPQVCSGVEEQYPEGWPEAWCTEYF